MTLPQTFAGIVPGVRRHYSAGPRHAYCYTYADPASVGPRQPLQLEFWIAKGRKGGQWVRSHDAPLMPDGFRPWRLVMPGHSHADRLAHSIAAVRSCGHAMTKEMQCETYLAWARARGLSTVSVYAGPGSNGYGASAAKAMGFERRPVSLDDYTGPAPAPEIDPEAYI